MILLPGPTAAIAAEHARRCPPHPEIGWPQRHGIALRPRPRTPGSKAPSLKVCVASAASCERSESPTRTTVMRCLRNLAAVLFCVVGRLRGMVSAGAVGLRAVLDADDVDNAGLGIDPVDDPVGAATCGVVAGELPLERFADPFGLGGQWADHELHDCCRDALRKATEGPLGWPGDHEFPVVHLARYFVRSSLAVTMSPLSMACSAARMSRIAEGFDRISRVSSRDSRSSGLRMTAAGRPWRVKTTRSWCSSTPSTISDRRFLISASGNVTSDMTMILVTSAAGSTERNDHS